MHIDKNNQEILVVSGMQNDYIDGVLENPAAKRIIPAVIEEIRQWEGKVVAIRGTNFTDNYMDSVEGKRLPMHCECGTEGWEVEATVDKALKDQCATFVNMHGFGYINWPKVLFGIDSTDQDAIAALTAGKGIRLRFVGACTDLFIANVAICRTLFPDAVIEIAEGATAASFDDANQKSAFDVCRSLLCDVIPTVYEEK